MNIILAISDRDLLSGYSKLLTTDGHTVSTAFDGTQAAPLLAKGPLDLAVLEAVLPRMESGRLIELFHSEGVPVILLLDERIALRHLLARQLPEAYLSFPFLPEDLRQTVESISRARKSDERIRCNDIEIEVSRFRFRDSQIPLTLQEIDLMRALNEGRRVGGKRARMTILALNEKLRRMGRTTRIQYELENGYRLVNEDD